jgi:hypothetical protein
MYAHVYHLNLYKWHICRRLHKHSYNLIINLLLSSTMHGTESWGDEGWGQSRWSSKHSGLCPSEQEFWGRPVNPCGGKPSWGQGCVENSGAYPGGAGPGYGVAPWLANPIGTDPMLSGQGWSSLGWRKLEGGGQTYWEQALRAKTLKETAPLGPG